MFSKQFTSSLTKQSSIQKSSSSRPSSTHVDKFTSKATEKPAEQAQGSAPTTQTKLSTPTRTTSIEIAQDSQTMRVIFLEIFSLNKK